MNRYVLTDMMAYCKDRFRVLTTEQEHRRAAAVMMNEDGRTVDNSKSVHKLACSLRSLSHLARSLARVSLTCRRLVCEREQAALSNLPRRRRRPHSFGDPSANIQGPSVVEETVVGCLEQKLYHSLLRLTF